MEYNALAIKPQLCLKADESLLKKPQEIANYICERKYDGTRILPHFDDNGIKLFTRNGKNELSKQYPEIIAAFEEIGDIPSGTIYDGELVFMNSNDEVEFQSALITRENAQQRGLRPVLILFDALRLGTYDASKEDVLSRKLSREEYIFESKHIQLAPYYTNPAYYYDYFLEECENGREGIILKDKDSAYQENARNKSWLKFKRHDTMDCVVLGITEGTGKYKDTFGALILGMVTGNSIRVCGYCSGMTDAEREELYNRIMDMDEYTYNKKFSKPTVRTIAPTIVVEVEYMEMTEYLMMRHPRFVRVRDDKTIDIPQGAYPTKTEKRPSLSEWGF